MRWNTRSASSGSTVRSWPIMPPTRALTPTSTAELGEVGAQPEPDRPLRRGGVASVSERSSRLPVAAAQSSGPPTATATSVRPWRARMLAAVMARSPCPHITVIGRRAACGAVASAPSSTWRHRAGARASYSCVLADVDDRPVELGRVDERDGGDRLAGGLPGAHPAGELAQELLVADVEGLADELGAVLVGVEDEHQGRVGSASQPSQVANTGRSDRERARDVARRRRRRPGGRRRPRPPSV